MIKKLKIDLRNCFGIKKLEHEFGFDDKQHTQLVYAPNGSMKTSFAKTLKYLSGQTKDKPSDLLHPDRVPIFEMLSDEKETPPENIYVLNGDDEIDSSDSFVNFLASDSLKNRYDSIFKILSESKNSLITKLKTVSLSSNCEEELLATFRDNDDDTIFSVLGKIGSYPDSNTPLFEFRYNDIFDSKGAVEKFISENKESLNEYIRNYEKLMNESSLFRTDNGATFGTYQAAQLSSSLSDDSFFKVRHYLKIKDSSDIITSHEQFDKMIEDEKQKVFENAELRNIFEKITKAIDRNAELRNFKKVIEQHPDWIPEIINYSEFKKKVWLGYLGKDEIKFLVKDYADIYTSKKAEIEEILAVANSQQEKWNEIINLYNSRFRVPIKVGITNQRDIILKKEAAKLQFFYQEEGKEPIAEDRKHLEEILSRGEKRAFMILQFLFEIEARKNSNHDTILVLDDISDSFDYQNKYAIIEYIKDLTECSSPDFYSIILTHNYDFYRTLSSRLCISRSNAWMAVRSQDGISLNVGEYRGNVFANVFVKKADNDKFFISMIPFVRNLIEYTEGTSSPNYTTLTNCLHLKKDETESVTEEQIIKVIMLFAEGKDVKRELPESKIYSLIMRTADSIAGEDNPNPVALENKIVLSIAIRLLAEKYMHEKLLRAGCSESDLSTTKNQTNEWSRLYKKLYPEEDNKYIIERVNMMTPEVIHINSFMYEPLIDMSVYHLCELYSDCKAME